MGGSLWVKILMGTTCHRALIAGMAQTNEARQ